MDGYRHLVEGSPDGILIVDEDRIAFANRAARAVFGARDSEHLVGRSIADCIDADRRDPLRRYLARCLAVDAAPPLDATITRPDGTATEVSILAVPLPHQGERALQVIVRDATAQQNAHRLLRESEERLMLAI